MCSESELKSKSQIMAILIYLKRIALFRYHYLFSEEQFENIRQAAKEIHLENKKNIIKRLFLFPKNHEVRYERP